ncbi:YceD family protein [Leptolyngbya sp. NIES-2104]|uniref:YceD family protein n=1 Tax=Leptolyngbya sp. NIES-2104 TaxID=1552121 RepID=UPI0006EC66AB|nr:YceD family protein [Leptolyngbya sp. NIES-2104]GAP94987.1 metal-binding, possibly nucleic acid-binding protein [Leptolyngbya sp. NIES-2104]
MEAIHIPRLVQCPEQTKTIEFKTFLKDLKTLTPVQGWIKITHQGNFLEISAKVETIITLTCHRCLQQFNHRLAIEPKEMIWLDETADQLDELPLDKDLSMDDLVETLLPNGYFDPEAWLYEQLSLEIPQRQLCAKDCAGIEVADEIKSPGIDSRWAALQALKGHLN